MEYDLTKCHMEKTVMLLCSEHISLRQTPAGTDGESLHHVDPEQALKTWEIPSHLFSLSPYIYVFNGKIFLYFICVESFLSHFVFSKGCCKC